MEKLKIILKICRTFVELLLKKIIHRGFYFNCVILKSKSAKIKINRLANLSIGAKVRLDDNCDIRSSKNLSIGRGSEIGVGTAIISTKTGTVEIEENVFLHRNCTVVSCEKIVIGAGTAIGYNVVILDHDHYYVKDGPQPWNKIKTAPVIIGKNVWIGANVTILAGTTIGDNAVIAAGSVIKGDIPKSKLILQKRSTEYREIK